MSGRFFAFKLEQSYSSLPGRDDEIVLISVPHDMLLDIFESAVDEWTLLRFQARTVLLILAGAGRRNRFDFCPAPIFYYEVVGLSVIK
ncbi:hypothetical protein NP71_05745 [Staphylococcus schleiferi]|nr:hypothetical protein NP71_05745 [Staphylococcus schleiferi]AKS71296.1 hypothetical protein OA96_05630 [Staphylococcus schleiferi]